MIVVRLLEYFVEPRFRSLLFSHANWFYILSIFKIRRVDVPPFLLFKWIWNIWFFLIHLLDLGVFFQRFDPLLLFRPFLIPKDESLLRKNIETFSSLVFCDLKNTNHTYLRLFKYLLTMGIEYYRNHTSIRPCSHTLTCDLPKVP